MIRFALPFAFILLAGCARSEPASYTQIDNEAAPALPANSQAESDDDEPAIGTWHTGLQDDQAVLEFGPSGAQPLFSIGCDARRTLMLQRHGAVPAGDLPVMLVTVGSETRRLAIAAASGVTPMLRGTLPPNDPFRPVLAAASSPIIVRIGDSPPLVLPPSPAIGTYAAQCASGDTRPTTAPAGNAVEANQTAIGNMAADAD